MRNQSSKEINAQPENHKNLILLPCFIWEIVQDRKSSLKFQFQPRALDLFTRLLCWAKPSCKFTTIIDIITKTLLPNSVEDGWGLSYFYLLNKRKQTYVDTAFLHSTYYLLSHGSKDWKSFNSLSHVKLLGWREPRKRWSKGYCKIMRDTTITFYHGPLKKITGLRDLNFVPQHSQSSWSILVGSLSNLKKLEGDTDCRELRPDLC